MNILYLSMNPIMDISYADLHCSLVRKFRDEGHQVYLVSPRERRSGITSNLYEENGIHNLGVKTLNVLEANLIEKGIGQILIGPLFKRAIVNYFRSVQFDVIAYATPPITLVSTIRFLKKKNPRAITYLTLKDIFPQNAVDIGMLSKKGFKGVIYRYFRRMEKNLYRVSDWIGCMSPANVDYVLQHNPEINRAKVEICPNALEVTSKPIFNGKDYNILKKYGLPTDRPIFFYGGNLGKPQGIPFLVKCLDTNKYRTDCHFLIVGEGTEYDTVKDWYDVNKNHSVTLLRYLPRTDYDQLAQSCDVGLIFLDYRFTIPNYPSRLLNCLMQMKPIIACTDPNCDTGPIAEKNGYGYWCPSNSTHAFSKTVDRMLASDIKQMGENGYQYFLDNYTVQNTYEAIVKHLAK